MKDFPSFLREEISKGTRNADGRESTFNKYVRKYFFSLPTWFLVIAAICIRRRLRQLWGMWRRRRRTRRNRRRRWWGRPWRWRRVAGPPVHPDRRRRRGRRGHRWRGRPRMLVQRPWPLQRCSDRGRPRPPPRRPMEATPALQQTFWFKSSLFCQLPYDHRLFVANSNSWQWG